MDVQILDGDLDDVTLRSLLRSPAVAMDTETTGLDWETATLQIVQLFSLETGPIVVLLSRTRPSRLIELLESAAVEKVFHHAPFDLQFIARAWDVRARSIRCTKTASKIAHRDWASSEHSLGALVSSYLGVILNKGAVRVSDWSQRPLDASQVEYAVADVLHLLDLSARLERELGNSGLLSDMYQSACEYIPVDAYLVTHGYRSPLEY